MTNDYDYIVVGAGAAGLSLLVHLINAGCCTNKRILLIERNSKTENDRTWCFWEASPGPFEQVVSSSWQQLKFILHDGTTIKENIAPYWYKLIRGTDFYTYAFEAISKQSNINVMSATVSAVQSTENGAGVVIDGNLLTAQYVFNSVLFEKVVATKNTYLLLQHFTGWFIKSNSPLFVPDAATLMDFRTAQENGTSFFYVMPFSSTEALIEYTLFSPQLLDEAAYTRALKSYCSDHLRLVDADYTVTHVEKGSIPMTNYRFATNYGNVINIGTAGGQTKPSSGYTFRFIQKDCERIVACLAAGRSPATLTNRLRNNLYDSILLNILSKRKMDGSSIFETLFRTNRMTSVFRFLDNETSLAEELKIISGLPVLTFSRAAVSHLLR